MKPRGSKRPEATSGCNLSLVVSPERLRKSLPRTQVNKVTTTWSPPWDEPLSRTSLAAGCC
jgi:hypothetical protein